MRQRRYRWLGADDPSRVESAVVRFEGTGLRAHGGSVASDYATAWRLRVGEGWVTEELSVSSAGDGWDRTLVLTRGADGRWSTAADARGEAGMPDPGMPDPSVVDGAVDCDLGLCPLTNTMPIRRLGLLDRDAEQVPLVMAWVEVPSLRVLRSDQLYGSGGAAQGSARTVRYASRSRDFDAELTVDGDGVVIDYPTLARRSGVGPRIASDSDDDARGSRRDAPGVR